jgi:hypothetical protein
MAAEAVRYDEWRGGAEAVTPVRRPHGERRRMLEYLLSGEAKHWTDSAIARRVRCSINYVSAVRRRLGLTGIRKRRSERPGKGNVPAHGVVDMSKRKGGRKSYDDCDAFWLRCPHCNKPFREAEARLV